MDEHAAFHAAILAAPDDDLPRLVYADYLDDHDHPVEAELIRLQCHLEPRRGGVPHTDAKPLFIREQELLPQVRVGEVWPAAGGNLLLEWVRGVPARVTLTCDELLGNGAAVLDAFPTVRQVAVCDVRHRGPELAGCELLARLDALELADWLTRTDVAFLIHSPHLGELATLRLWAHQHEHATALRHIDPTVWRPRRRVEVVYFDNNTRWRDEPRVRALWAAWGPDACLPVAPWERAFMVNAPPGGPDPFRTGTAPCGSVGSPFDGRTQLLALPAADDRVVVLEFGEHGEFGRRPKTMVKPPGASLDDWLAELDGWRPGPIWVGSFATRLGHTLEWLPEAYRHGMTTLTETPEENGGSRRIKVWLAGGYALTRNWRGDGLADVLGPEGKLCPRA